MREPTSAAQTLFTDALRHHRNGLPLEAERLYREALAIDSHHADSLHMLGILAYQSGRLKMADKLIRRAVTINVQSAAFLSNLGNTRREQGQPDDAIHCFLWAAALRPDATEININLGNALREHGLRMEAVGSYRRALTATPSYAEGYYNLGLVRQDEGRQDEAIECYRRAIALKPAYPEAHYNFGLAWQYQERQDEAIGRYRATLVVKPDHREAHNNLANALKTRTDVEDAATCYQRALVLGPHVPEAHYNWGCTRREQGRLTDAIANFSKALALRPDYTEAINSLGAVYWAQRRLIEARKLAIRAIATTEDGSARAAALASLATVEAYLSDYRRVLELSDGALDVDGPEPSIWERRLYTLSYHPDLTVERIYAEFVRWGELQAQSLTAMPTASNDRDPERRLRVGFVSPDFRRHTSRFYFAPLFTNHDRTQIELYAYSNVARPDDQTAVFQGMFDHWRDIRGLSDGAAADLVRADGIDILVDGCNHMEGNRLGVFALKPAPVQVTWLGAAWTTGLPAMDYVLFDRVLAPEGTLAREAIVRLPGCFIAFQASDKAGPVAAAPCLSRGHVTFGYFGRTERLNHRCLKVWGAILAALPESRLILDFRPFADAPTRAWYARLLADLGVDVERVAMRWSADVFAGLGDIDIMLDCFPHSGGTMLLDALWMGVPALTLASRPPLGRLGTTFMSHLGLDDWVAVDESDYLAKAQSFAGNLPALADLRRGLRARMAASPLCDGAGFARNVEAAYRTMWRRWCGGLPAEAFMVEKVS